MRKLLMGALAMGQVSGSAAAQLQTPQQREAYLAYVVAAANAEGDVSTDRAMAKMLGMYQDGVVPLLAGPAPHSDRERSLLAEAQVIQARLEARAEAATLDRPDLLAMDLGCWPVGATPELCEQRRARLEALAGDNAYYHMVLMGTAWQLKEASAYLHHARAAAAASHYRSAYGDQYERLHQRFLKVPESLVRALGDRPQDMPQAGMMAMTLSAAYALPNYQGFSTPCREAEGELRELCLTIALMQLESPGSLIDSMVAAGVIEALGNADERALAQSSLRTLNWQQAQMGRLSQRETAGARTLGYDAYFLDYGKKGELVAMRELLEANGLAADPPPDWTPPAP